MGFSKTEGFKIFCATSFFRAAIMYSCTVLFSIHVFCGGSNPVLSFREVIDSGSLDFMLSRKIHLVQPARILKWAGKEKTKLTSSCERKGRRTSRPWAIAFRSAYRS